MRRGSVEEERFREQEGGREGGCRQRKSTADPPPPLVSAGRDCDGRVSLFLCQPLKGLLYTIHQPLCARLVDNREILPQRVSVLGTVQIHEGQREVGPH